ncbi:hypothetical protein J2S78_003089 [Salibacterium salarium]|nr:hypothetical protein [Salibacterium salarium]
MEEIKQGVGLNVAWHGGSLAKMKSIEATRTFSPLFDSFPGPNTFGKKYSYSKNR